MVITTEVGDVIGLNGKNRAVCIVHGTRDLRPSDADASSFYAQNNVMSDSVLSMPFFPICTSLFVAALYLR